ncbi:MAG: helix-turn-helix transcriptional regulator [Clostridia bacterium]|nr:helix-turn-helix transcriptional regulator [Clostridia bacterium]
MKKSEIAEAIGVSRATVSQYVSGRAQPTLATLSKLCTVLDCSADDILQVKRK